MTGNTDWGIDDGLNITAETLERLRNPNKMDDSQKEKVAKKVLRLLQNNEREEIKKTLLQRLWRINGANILAEKLFAIRSDLALQKVKEILADKNSQESDIQGTAIYMLTYYWTLASNELWTQDKAFLWYQALGGEVWDELYTEQQALADEHSYELTDEVLLLTKIEPQRFDSEINTSHRMSYN